MYNTEYRVQYLDYTQWSPVWFRVHVDTHVVTTVDFLTSLVAGVVIFSMLGHTAHKLNIPMSEVAKGGQGLAFVAYPEVLYTKEDNSSAKLP
jgi:SNF family Na+-dependent transporter